MGYSDRFLKETKKTHNIVKSWSTLHIILPSITKRLFRSFGLFSECKFELLFIVALFVIANQTNQQTKWIFWQMFYFFAKTELTGLSWKLKGSENPQHWRSLLIPRNNYIYWESIVYPNRSRTLFIIYLRQNNVLVTSS